MVCGFQSVEKRLIEENAALSKERAHLADLMRNLQSIQNEMERSQSDSRRRLEEQVNRLEAQAAELKANLARETDGARQLALRKELDGKTYQDKLDKVAAELQAAREAHLVARTSLEHQEARVSDLQLQVAAREDKLAVYEGRGVAGGVAGGAAGEPLEVAVAELRAELRAAQSELERARANLAQYQAIAETEGESLRQVTATYDEFKAAMDRTLAEKEAEIGSVRERLHALTTDLTTAQTDNSELHRQIEAERQAFEKERQTLEDGLANLRSADEGARQAQLAAQEDLRRQAGLAKDAHDKYDRELVAHAEDVKRLADLRDELAGVKGQVGEAQATAEVARANLARSEESWKRQRDVLEQEVGDVQKRCDDLAQQNAVLHEHLETFNTHAAKLQAAKAAGGEDVVGHGEGPDAASAEALAASVDASGDQLREVIRYLRREKDIVDLQLEFAKQESTRLRQQLEFTTRGLDEARAQLAQERAKGAEAGASSEQHKELLEKIHTATLLRESNQTLREESQAHLRKAGALEAKLRVAVAELEPLKEKVQTLTAEVDARQHSVRLLEEDNERWKVRNQTILAKYERIDPEELATLKAEVARLSAEKDAVDVRVAEAEKAGQVGADEVRRQKDELEKALASMTAKWTDMSDKFKRLQAIAKEQRTAAATATVSVSVTGTQSAGRSGQRR